VLLCWVRHCGHLWPVGSGLRPGAADRTFHACCSAGRATVVTFARRVRPPLRARSRRRPLRGRDASLDARCRRPHPKGLTQVTDPVVGPVEAARHIGNGVFFAVKLLDSQTEPALGGARYPAACVSGEELGPRRQGSLAELARLGRRWGACRGCRGLSTQPSHGLSSTTDFKSKEKHIELTKSVSAVCSPVTSEVVEIDTGVVDDPAILSAQEYASKNGGGL
jgi:hypothetical protein